MWGPRVQGSVARSRSAQGSVARGLRPACDDVAAGPVRGLVARLEVVIDMRPFHSCQGGGSAHGHARCASLAIRFHRDFCAHYAQATEGGSGS